MFLVKYVSFTTVNIMTVLRSKKYLW